jgi:hypothetical protein
MELYKVTPLSKMIAIIFFVGVVPALCFYIGTVYMDVIQVMEYSDAIAGV